MSLTVTVQKGHDFSSGNVTRAALNAGAVPTVAVTGSVSTTEIIDGAVTNAKLATDSVEASEIKALAVTTGKLAADAVTLEKLANASVTSDNLLVSKNATSTIQNIVDGLNEITGDVAVDDYVIVHDTSADGEDDEQLFKAKVSKVQKVGTTEYVSAIVTATGTSPSYTVEVDMDGTPFQTITFTDPVGFYNVTPSNLPATGVKTVTLKIVCSTGSTPSSFGLSGGLDWPAGWSWPERAANIGPANITNGKVALLSLTAFGSAIVAAYAVTLPTS